MIELKRHIEILLLDNDCVIVPGLGGFVAHHLDARYDARDGVFLPPLRTLGFNQKLDMNDSLLAQSYVEAYDMSYPEAVRKIEEEVGELKMSIQKDGFYDFSDIGTLVLNAEGNYEFDPCESGILTPELYGLSSVDVCWLDNLGVGVAEETPVAGETDERVRRENTDETKRSNGSLQVFPYGESKLAERLAADEDGEQEKTISIKVSFLRNIVAVACAVVAFLMLATPINNNTDEMSASIGGIGNGLLYNLVPADVHSSGSSRVEGRSGTSLETVGGKAGKYPEKNSPKPVDLEEKIPANAAEPSVVKSSSDGGKYCIVLACRITKSNAKAYVVTLQGKGFSQARVLDEAGEPLKVVYGEFESKTKALSELDKFSDSKAFEGAWIYKEME